MLNTNALTVPLLEFGIIFRYSKDNFGRIDCDINSMIQFVLLNLHYFVVHLEMRGSNL